MHPHYRSNAQDDSLAQQVEHIPFKDGVLGSNPRRITENKRKIKQIPDNQTLSGISFFWQVAENSRFKGSYRNPEGLKYNHLLKYLLHLPISSLIVFKYLL